MKIISSEQIIATIIYILTLIFGYLWYIITNNQTFGIFAGLLLFIILMVYVYISLEYG